jgi:hypothetical protein
MAIDKTGHITVTTAGTPVSGPNVKNEGGFLFRIHSVGSAAWFFDSDSTAAADGYPIDEFGNSDQPGYKPG